MDKAHILVPKNELLPKDWCICRFCIAASGVFGVTPGTPLSCPIASLPFARFFFIALRLVSRIDSFLDGVQPIVAFLIFVLALRYELSGGETTLCFAIWLVWRKWNGSYKIFFFCFPNGIQYVCLRSMHHEFLYVFFEGFVIADLLIRTNTFASQKHYRSTTLVRYPPQKASIKLRGEIVIYIQTKSCPNFTTIC